jgi:tetratricopeptide (TPR) repeat protein
MAEKHGSFMASAIILLILSFGLAFFVALFGIGSSGVMFTYALRWELLSALLMMASWAPAILLVSSALVTEGMETPDGFTSAASRALIPALVMAFSLSIFYLLLVPGIAERRNWYVTSSTLFEDSIRSSMRAYEAGDFLEADRILLAVRTMDPDEPRYVKLNDLIKQAIVDSHYVPDSLPSETADSAQGLQFAANRFYLEALEEMEAGRYIEAHYLAKRSAALFPNRLEVRRLVEESWRAMQATGPAPEEMIARGLYERKLYAYSRFNEGDFLTAYRVFNELAAENPDDLDIDNYLQRSATGLESISFFLDEDEKAFSQSIERDFIISYQVSNGELDLQASGTAASPDGIYFRDLRLTRTGSEPLDLVAPFARLKGSNLIVRAVDRVDPYKVHEAIYTLGGQDPVTRHVISLPFDESAVLVAFRMSGHPADIPLAVLATGIAQAALFGIPEAPLMAELAVRSAYPFVAVMLVLVGVALGFRFRPEQPLSLVRSLLGAPLMVALALVPIGLAGRFGRFMAETLAYSVSGQLYLPVWLAFLGTCTALSLFLSAHIASHAR